MGENSGIPWTDHTFNGWIGCTEAGPACDSCYARAMDARLQFGIPKEERRTDGQAPHWGIGAPRHRTAAGNWNKVHGWNADAAVAKRPIKVFAHSLSDVFDKEVPDLWRADLFRLWRETPNLRWIVVTKRAPLIAKMLPPDWGDGYPNVGLMATVCDQDEFERDFHRITAIPARWHGFSIEPQIGRIEPHPAIAMIKAHRGSIWLITGGESVQKGHEPRVYDIDWADDIIQIGRAAPNAYAFVKQLGSRPYSDGRPMHGGGEIRTDAGEDPRLWPERLRVRKFPPELLA